MTTTHTYTSEDRRGDLFATLPPAGKTIAEVGIGRCMTLYAVETRRSDRTVWEEVRGELWAELPDGCEAHWTGPAATFGSAFPEFDRRTGSDRRA